MGELNWNLDDPELGPLERIGLAGLYAALKASRDDEHDLSPLEFDLTPTAVSLSWPEDTKAQDVLVPLVEWAWQARGAPANAKADERLGVLYFPGIHRGALAGEAQERLPEHSGILSTFLQHNRVQPKSKPLTSVIQIDNHPLQTRWVEPKKSLKYPQEASSNKLFLKGKLRDGSVSVSSFLVPGATARHGGEASWEGSASLAYLLLFAPTTCYYMQIRGAEWVVVMPDVQDLKEYCKLRRAIQMNLADARAINLADAGLAVMTALATDKFRRTVERRQGLPSKCLTFRIGEVAWNRQNVRSNALQIHTSPQQLDAYKTVRELLANKWVTRKSDDGEETEFIGISYARDPVTANILDEQTYWYRDLFEIPRYHQDAIQRQSRTGDSVDRTWFRLLSYEGKALRTLFNRLPKKEEAMEETFLEAFDHALRARYKQEAIHSARGARSVVDRMGDFREQFRRSLMRANTRPVLRSVLAEFFAEAGVNTVLQEHRIEIWQFIDGQHSWKQARDLALLGLVSYASASKDNQEEE